MKKTFFAIIWSGLFFSYSAIAAEQAPLPHPSSSLTQPPQSSEEERIVLFTPPLNWHFAEPSSLPSLVKVMVVGKGPSPFPPSLNLSWEPYQGTLRQYLKIIKELNSAQGYEWKDLGLIKTEAGNASLSQVDTKNQWGNVRFMHTILLHNGRIYVLTASALRDEFPLFYKDFFAAMRSLRILKDVYEMVNLPQRTQLKATVTKLQTQWQIGVEQKQKEYPNLNEIDLQENVFNSENFQNTIWKPFKEMIEKKYGDLGAEWKSLFLQKIEDQLFSVKSN